MGKSRIFAKKTRIIMDIIVEVNDRLGAELTTWCSANGKKVCDYAYTALYDRFMTDKYGDLNERYRQTVVADTAAPQEKRELQEPLPDHVSTTPSKQGDSVVRSKTLNRRER